jgi:hypothetical protein
VQGPNRAKRGKPMIHKHRLMNFWSAISGTIIHPRHHNRL